MKTQILLMAVITVLFAQGCAKKEQKTLAKSSRSSRTPTTMVTQNGGQVPNPGTASPMAGKVWASMTQRNQDFARSVKAFVSSNMDPESLGTVSGVNNYDGTGIRFWGNIDTTQRISTTGSNQAQITSYSSFMLSIWDSYAGKQNMDGQMVSEYAVYFQGNVWGYVWGNYVEIRFEDSYGNVTLRGDISGATFNGYFSFENNQFYDGSSPGAAADNIWAFSIPTCSFFNCQ